jgi:hypothetical protein
MKYLRPYLTRRNTLLSSAVLVLIALAVFLGPLALSGPRIVRVTPSDGATDVNPRGPIRVEFDQWVLPGSVMATLDPAVPFTMEWQRNAVVIQPQQSLNYATRYRLTLSSARNVLGRASTHATPIAFATVPYVTVAQFGPRQGATEVAQRAPITVEFAAPIVPAETIAEAAHNPTLADSLPQPLTLTPEQPGVGRWLSPTLYGFYPQNDLRAATTYTATVRADVTPDGRSRLEQPVSWQFTTQAPVLAGTRPYDGATEVAPTSPIEVRLASDVDTASAQQHFSLRNTQSGETVTGAIEASAGSLRFQPAAPLDRSVRYEAQLAPGIRATTGAALNKEPLTWSFTVMGDLTIAQVEPPADTAEVLTTTKRISVRFNHPVVAVTSLDAQAPLPQPLTITPALPGEGGWLDTSTYVYSPTVALTPSTRYHVRVAPGLPDQTGGKLNQEYSWSFTTINPAVVTSLPAPDEQHASPRNPLKISFNQPMDLASLRAAIKLRRSDGANVSGSVAANGSTATFTPAEPLERGARYILSVDRSARPSDGNSSLAKTYEAPFRVAPLPRLVRSTPTDGETKATVNAGIQLVFSTPLDWTSVERNLTIEPKPTKMYTSTNEADFFLGFPLKPETDYRITLGAAAQDPYGVTLGKDVTIAFHTGSVDPALSIVGPPQIGAYNAYVPARVPLRHVGTPRVSYRLARVDLTQVPDLLNNYDTWQQFKPEGAALLKEGEQQLPGGRNEERIDLLDLGRLDPGMYYVEVRSPNGLTDRRLMSVSSYTLTLKRSADKLFIWAIDLASGKPVADLPLLAKAVVFSPNPGENQQPDLRELGWTDGEGILHTPFTSSNIYDPLYVWSPGEQFAFTTTSWSNGITPWEFGLPADYGSRPVVGSISTDRPIYQPEHTVYIRGALRSDKDGRYSLPDAGQRAHVTIIDPQGTTVLTTTLPLSEFGTFDTSLTLARSAKLGGYTMAVRLDTLQAKDPSQPPAAQGSFTVAEYRKPAFEVTVTPAKSDLIQGETLEVEVAARYFSSGPVGNAPVRWRLQGYPLFFASESTPNFRFEDFDDAYEAYRWFEAERGPRGGELVSEGSARTDAQGRFKLRLPANLGKENHSRTLTLSVEVTDVDGQVIAGQGQAKVHVGAFYIGMRPEGYVAQVGQPQNVSLITVDPQDRPVPQRALEIGIYQREWYSVREQGSDGQLYWTSKFTDTLVETQKATTDAQGRGSISFTVKQGGSYRIVATGRDDGGHTIKASVFTWVSGREDTFWGVNDTNRLDLIADKDRYKPGDTAKILVPAPYKGTTALMTIERGNVIEHRLLTIQGSTELIEVPISADYAPNIYVSLVLVKAADKEVPTPDLRVGLINLPVSTEQQELTISVTPDKETAGPRDEVAYTIKATDHTGRGVRAEVGLALVDKSVLALADDPNPSLREAFYEKRPLGVITAQSLTVLMDRVTLRVQGGRKGGGGSAGGDPLVRREFPDTAYWNPSVVTSEDGTAKIALKLPDTLTTWQMTARGLTGDTRVGEATTDLIATRPLLVRPSLPRFLTIGDTPILQAVIHNTTSAAIDATIMLDPGTIVLNAAKQQTVNVPAGGQTVVRWAAEVPEAGETTLRFVVQGGGLEDALEQTLTIQRYTTPEVVASAGQVQDTTVETLQPPSDRQGEVRLELVPSLAAGITSGLEYLEHYPYGCTEQTVSRFLPNAVTYRLYRHLGIQNQELKTALETNLTVAVQRLASLQHLDGGWGWWSDDQSDPYLTAYVVQGLLEARKAGYGVDQQMLDMGIAYLQAALDDDTLAPTKAPWHNDARSYVLFVLAEAGKADHGRTIALYDKHTDLAIYGRAYLLMTLKTLGNEDERVQTLIGELMSTAILGPTHGHWEEQEQHYWTMNSDTRTTALALQALVRSDPDNFLVPNAVRYLMSIREDGHWRTTQESAVALMALAEYSAQSGEFEADYSYRATLDGKPLREGNVNRDTLDDPINVVIALADLKAGSANQLSLQRQAGNGQSGKGRLYYTLRMRYYEDAGLVQPLDQGLAVQRDYIAVNTDTLTPTGQLIQTARVGEVVQVRLTLTVPENVRYLAVEDMLPAGLEPLDASLKTVTDVAQDPTLASASPDQVDWRYFAQTEIHHNRVALFATELPKGTYHYTYLARATTAGTFQTLPALAYQMYAPEVFGRSAGTSFAVSAP